MDTEALRAAVAAGDESAVARLLDDAPRTVLAGPAGAALLTRAVRAGRHRIVERLVAVGADPDRTEFTGGVDLVAEAADRGAYSMVMALLPGPVARQRRALEAARAWLGCSEEDELRRRLGGGPDVTFAYEDVHEDVDPDNPHLYDPTPVAVRIHATAADGRTLTVETAHRALVTAVEKTIGTFATTADELADRALHHARHGFRDWQASVWRLADRADEESFACAARLIRSPEPSHRRFALDLLAAIATHLFLPHPWRHGRQALDLLRAYLATDEDHPELLDGALFAHSWYAHEYGTGEDLYAILPFGSHHDGAVRERVLHELGPSMNRNPAVVDLCTTHCDDPRPDTREAALHALATYGPDSPELRSLFVDRLTDPHAPARLEAAAGLALRHDPRGDAVLARFAADAEPESPTWWRLDEVRRLRARTAPAG
ncbi:HEAT repeat domain-containing protein [Streptomyces sp. MOE7]|uniref:HEAT repeat domain-containing protein n=1 Tax=Streptomyces sp. MOE7 TaxID=1961713 RepID=UPI0011E4CA28|nr:HEAT repeat domain-containing protein [Streptomyces sp. MOE7]